MKHLLSLCLLLASLCGHAQEASGNYVESDLFGSLRPGDKAAILMVHFGTTHDDTRALTIDAINEKMKAAFPNVEIREAWTSRIVAHRLKARGIERLNPAEALERLKADGYTHILVQSSNIIEGIEMESLRREIAAVRDSFREIRLGHPLLYTPEDYEAVIDAISKNGAKEGATVLVGHGTHTTATAQYAMLDYMLKAEGLTAYSVGTIEGYPTFETMEAQVKASGARKILLMPFLFVAGDHAKNDIAGEWKEELEKKGYEVSVFMEGLGQNPDIQDIFIDHARFTAKNRTLDISEKKKAYASGRD